MIYRCTCCHLIFDEPDVMRRRENLDDENWTITTQTVCPYCGTDNITEVKDEPLSD